MEISQRKARPTSLVIPGVPARPRPSSLIMPHSTSRTRPISLVLPHHPAEQNRRGSLVLDCFMPSTTSPVFKSPSTLSSSSASPGDSDVFMSESAFGSFCIDPNLTPEANLNLVARLRHSSSRSRSSSDDSPTKKKSSTKSSFLLTRSSVKKALRKSVPFLVGQVEGSASQKVSPLDLELLNGIKEDLLHVYRTNTFPPTGLTSFQNKAREVLLSGEIRQLEDVWQQIIIPEGTRTLSVRVASPRDGDKLTALIETWDTLYKNTLPLFQALLQPLSHWHVQEDVLCGFRDLVLPYADLDILLTEHGDDLNQHHRWRLTQILHILARLGPCTCNLASTQNGRRYDISPVLPFERPVIHAKFADLRDRTPSDEQNQTITNSVIHTGCRFVGSLLQIIMQQSGEAWTEHGNDVLERLLHLHHGPDAQATQHHLKFAINKESLCSPRSSDSLASLYQLLGYHTPR
ncbi:unnamed protein product [Meganyctiphanes norvegica]|uniref:Uncharacterized protein n=1 Tax=Meganyctiphanes norvegica TaxID=48144 RepID=A0AAV2QHF8_MEGNR